MRVCHITNDIAEASGVGTFVRRVQRELAGLGVDSHVLTEVPDALDDAELPDIVHIHGMWLGVHRAAIRWAKSAGAKVVWSTHGMTAPWSMRHKWWKKAPAWLLYQWRDLLSADLVHATTDQEADWNRRWYLKRQCVIPLGTMLPREVKMKGEQRCVDSGGGSGPSLPAIDSPTEDALERDCGALGDRPLPRTLLYVGRIYPVKALDNAIRALALLNSANHEPRTASHARPLALRIVGPDQAGHMAELMALCDSLGLSCSKPGDAKSALQLQLETPTKLVQFVGPKFGSGLAAEYANCDCAILASHTENFGATIVDAMAHGKPVIAGTKTPWKIVIDRGCGWWVDNDPAVLSGAIAQMLNCSDAQLHDMGARGRQLVEERYTWSSVGKAMLAEYERLLKGNDL